MKSEKNIDEMIGYVKSIGGEELEINEQELKNSYERTDAAPKGLAVKLLSIFGGIMATWSFVGFLFMFGIKDSPLGLITFGVIFFIASLVIVMGFKSILLDTSSISIFLISFFLISLGLFDYKLDKTFIFTITMLLALVALILNRNYMFTFISVFLFFLSIFLNIITSKLDFVFIHIYCGILGLLLTYYVMNEAKIIEKFRNISELYSPVRVGLIFSLILGLIFIGVNELSKKSADYLWISSTYFSFGIIYLIHFINKKFDVKSIQKQILIYGLSILIVASIILAPAISGSLLIILLCFYVNFRTGLAVGIISFIYFIGQYYYDLNFTLLEKSIMMFATGILFIIIYFITDRMMGNEKV